MGGSEHWYGVGLVGRVGQGLFGVSELANAAPVVP